MLSSSSPAGVDGNDTDGHVETPGSSSSNTLMLLATSATEATKDLVPTTNWQPFNLQQDTRQVITDIYGWRSRLLDTASTKFLKAYQDFLQVYPEWGPSIAALELVKTYEPSSSDEEDEIEQAQEARTSFRSESSSSPRLKRNRREWATFRCAYHFFPSLWLNNHIRIVLETFLKPAASLFLRNRFR
jgi:hypothetical protein